MICQFGISRRLFLVVVAALALGHPHLAWAAGSDLTFLVFGDWGTGSKKQRRVAGQMGKAAEAIGARFVISTGDNFYPKGVKSVKDPQWKASFEDIYTAPALSVPWYVALGNHDRRGNVDAQVDYSKRSSRWRMPASYYKHTETLADGSRADFFFLDTDAIRKDYKRKKKKDPLFRHEQILWLERALAASTARWKFVIGHHPVFSGGKHGPTSALVVHLRPLLDRYGVQVYLNGHDHNLQHVVVGKVHYLTSGAGAKSRSAKSVSGTRFAAGNTLGFMTARLNPGAMEIEFIDGKGTSLYRASIPVGS